MRIASVDDGTAILHRGPPWRRRRAEVRRVLWGSEHRWAFAGDPTERVPPAWNRRLERAWLRWYNCEDLGPGWLVSIRIDGGLEATTALVSYGPPWRRRHIQCFLTPDGWYRDHRRCRGGLDARLDAAHARLKHRAITESRWTPVAR